MEKVLRASHERALVVPYMIRGATDGAFLRQKGMAVYGVPVFVRVDRDSRAHGNDERISLASFDSGVRLLWQMVTELR
jgi:acetylornithine deacetylase/succinyl-diaminopimelate desuccinylase-like protein